MENYDHACLGQPFRILDISTPVKKVKRSVLLRVDSVLIVET